MKQLFTDRFFAGNRRVLRERVGGDALILVAANGLLQRNSDVTYPFRQDSNFWYLTGITEPDITLVMDGDDEYLIVPGRDAVRSVFDGAVDMDALATRSGIRTVLDEAAGGERLRACIGKRKKLVTPQPAPAYITQHGFYTNPARATLIQKLMEQIPKLAITDIRETLAAMRCIKQAPELAAIQKAIDITADALTYVTDASRFTHFSHEYELEAELGSRFRYAGASGHAFAPIVAGGKRACMLHNVANTGRLAKRELVVLDIGAEYDLYAADITRTVPFGAITARQQAVLDAVGEVQDFALTLLKPGIYIKEYEQQVERFMGEKLQALGLITEMTHEAIRRYYPHATSHFMGLDVHDVGDYRQPLATDMVLTCEPGIYIPEEGIGVRIEDDVRITGDGNDVLSAALPRQLHS